MLGQEIEELAEKTRIRMIYEVIGDPREWEQCPGSQVKKSL